MSIDFLRNVMAGLTVLFMAVLAYVTAWLIIDVRWFIDLRGVIVEDSVVGEDPAILVSRDINRDFSGAYYVTIREQPSNSVACTTGRVPLNYEAATQPIEEQTLSWWAHGGSCTDVLEDRLPAGIYTMETCHEVVSPLRPPKQRCVQSGPFYVREADGA